MIYFDDFIHLDCVFYLFFFSFLFFILFFILFFHSFSLLFLQGVVSVTDQTRAIRACEVMSEKAINGLAVVDDSGKLVEVFSGFFFLFILSFFSLSSFFFSHLISLTTTTVKDLKGVGINAEQIWKLFVPVSEFKQMQRNENNGHNSPDSLVIG